MIKVHKAKIPTHLSFPFKTSMLESALLELKAGCPVELYFHEPELTGALFEAQFCPADDTCPEPHLRVLAGAVPSDSRKAMTEMLQEKVMLEFMVWLEARLNQAENAPLQQKRQAFHVHYVGGQLQITQEP
jgi:hypothetical protein